MYIYIWLYDNIGLGLEVCCLLPFAFLSATSSFPCHLQLAALGTGLPDAGPSETGLQPRPRHARLAARRQWVCGGVHKSLAPRTLHVYAENQYIWPPKPPLM